MGSPKLPNRAPTDGALKVNLRVFLTILLKQTNKRSPTHQRSLSDLIEQIFFL
ncbi:MAG: hypothetical protein F6K17_42495 [Okeania sp. SIO3C4]|nr:hypothetical protein [Okeania sp. SIO3B3]NER08730.1 hypothetical protein [Okeania sp. SIO3C4]